MSTVDTTGYCCDRFQLWSDKNKFVHFNGQWRVTGFYDQTTIDFCPFCGEDLRGPYPTPSEGDGRGLESNTSPKKGVLNGNK